MVPKSSPTKSPTTASTTQETAASPSRAPTPAALPLLCPSMLSGALPAAAGKSETAAPASEPLDSSLPRFGVTLVWQKVSSVSLVNPLLAPDSPIIAGEGILVFVSFSKGELPPDGAGSSDPPPAASDFSIGRLLNTKNQKLAAVSTFLHKGKLHSLHEPPGNPPKPCTLSSSSPSPSLTLVPMSSLTCKIKKNNVQYHGQLPPADSSLLYEELCERLKEGAPKNVAVRCGCFGDKQQLLIDSTEGPQMSSVKF